MINPIALEKIEVSIDGTSILENINLIIKPQNIQAVLGSTGSGKSVLLKLISGLIAADNGSIIGAEKLKISFVFQNNPFLPWLTIKKNLELVSDLSQFNPWLQRFKLNEYLEYYPKQLSGGTRQKFNLLRAFINQPDLILMDEPFAHLDIIQKEDLYDFTLQLWPDKKPAIILVTHDINEAIQLAHNVSFLSKKSKTLLKTLDLGPVMNADKQIHFEKLYNFYKNEGAE